MQRHGWAREARRGDGRSSRRTDVGTWATRKAGRLAPKSAMGTSRQACGGGTHCVRKIAHGDGERGPGTDLSEHGPARTAAGDERKGRQREGEHEQRAHLHGGAKALLRVALACAQGVARRAARRQRRHQRTVGCEVDGPRVGRAAAADEGGVAAHVVDDPHERAAAPTAAAAGRNERVVRAYVPRRSLSSRTCRSRRTRRRRRPRPTPRLATAA